MTNSIRTRLRARAFGYAALLALVSRTSAGAQSTGRYTPRTVPIDTLIAELERSAGNGGVGSYRAVLITSVLSDRSVSSARRDSLLSRLESVALSGRDEMARLLATGYVAFAGTSSNSESVASIHRLSRMYERAADRGVRISIINSMVTQIDRPAAVAFLRTIATQPDPATPRTMEVYVDDGGSDLRIRAIQQLAQMPPDGPAALRTMHRNREVPGAAPRQLLEALASRGFSLPHGPRP